MGRWPEGGTSQRAAQVGLLVGVSGETLHRKLSPAGGGLSRQRIEHTFHMEECHMTVHRSLMVAGAFVGFMSAVPTLAMAEPKAPLSIGDFDGIYVDGKSFKVIPGTANGDPSGLLERSGARELGPAAIVFRRGDKLYLTTALSGDRSFGGNARYFGSDREVGPTTAQGERERQDWQQDRRRYYGSDREVGPTTAQGERERQDWQQDRRRYYGSDREAGPTTAQGERERQSWQQDRLRYYGSDRDESPSTAQSEREWREWLQSQGRGNNRVYYGSDREAGPTTAQGERESRDWQQDRQRYYGSDRDESPSTAQSEREWREWLQSQRQSDNRRFGSDRYAVNDTEHAQDGLRRFFDENWTASDRR
jgi:hypothetical protein